MYVITATGGGQYKVAEGDIVKVEKFGAEVGETVTLDQVLAMNSGELAVGTSTVAGATVSGTVVEEGKTKKVIVYKYKRKSGYYEKDGHRQLYTQVRIDKINAQPNAMINATVLVDSKQNHTGIEMLGHAGLADDNQGEQELVCTVVSVLTLNMANSVEQFIDNTFETDVDEGTSLLKLQLARGLSSESKLLMSSLVFDLEGTAEIHGEPYIKIRFEEV